MPDFSFSSLIETLESGKQKTHFGQQKWNIQSYQDKEGHIPHLINVYLCVIFTEWMLTFILWKIIASMHMESITA